MLPLQGVGQFKCTDKISLMLRQRQHTVPTSAYSTIIEILQLLQTVVTIGSWNQLPHESPGRSSPGKFIKNKNWPLHYHRGMPRLVGQLIRLVAFSYEIGASSEIWPRNLLIKSQLRWTVELRRQNVKERNWLWYNHTHVTSKVNNKMAPREGIEPP